MHRSMLALAACALFPATALADDLVDNPTYQSWARFAVGATVEYRTVSDTAGNRSETIMVYTLTSSTAEKVVVEMKTTTIMAGQKYEQPAMPMEYAAKIEATALESNDPNIEKSEGSESIEVAGKKYDTKWYEVKTAASGMTTTSRTWMSDEIPGSYLRSVTKMEGPMTMTSETVLVSVKASAK